jgi:hypothetical protein
MYNTMYKSSYIQVIISTKQVTIQCTHVQNKLQYNVQYNVQNKLHTGDNMYNAASLQLSYIQVRSNSPVQQRIFNVKQQILVNLLVRILLHL